MILVKLLLLLVMSSLYHFNKPNVVDIRRNIYEGYPQLENIPLDHENEDVKDKLNKNDADLTESTVDTEETTDDKSSNQGREFRDDWII